MHNLTINNVLRKYLLNVPVWMNHSVVNIIEHTPGASLYDGKESSVW